MVSKQKPLNVITSAQTESDNINQMITIIGDFYSVIRIICDFLNVFTSTRNNNQW